GTVDVGVRFKPWWISGFDPFMGLGSPFGHGDPDACEGTAGVLNQDAVVRDASPLETQAGRAFEAVTSHDGAQRALGQQERLRPVGLAVVIGLPVRPIPDALAPYLDVAVVLHQHEAVGALGDSVKCGPQETVVPDDHGTRLLRARSDIAVLPHLDAMSS